MLLTPQHTEGKKESKYSLKNYEPFKISKAPYNNSNMSAVMAF